MLSFTGDTRNAGTAEIAMVRFSNHHISSGNRHTLRLDDVYVCDTSGSRNNDFLGDVKVVTLRPNADTAQADFTPSAGSVHYSLVAEAPDDDGDATYVESGTVGHKDLYGYQDLTGTPAAIMAVQLATVARKDDAGSRSLRAVLKSGATTANGATRVLGTSYAALRRPVRGRSGDRGGVDQGRRRRARRPGWRWWRDRRAAEPGSGRGAATSRAKARLSQQSAELLLQGTPRARLGQQAVEVLRSVSQWRQRERPAAR